MLDAEVYFGVRRNSDQVYVRTSDTSSDAAKTLPGPKLTFRTNRPPV